MDDLIGSVLKKRYRVDSFLGRGGMAEVYLVYDMQRMAPLAMKLLHDDLSEDTIFLRRFKREGKILENLQHPNIVRFYGLEEAADRVFMLMDYVDGTTLRKEIKNCDGRPFSVVRVMEIMRPICGALYFAHQNNMVHCDIKPANIMIKNTGQVLLTDFGIARQSESATSTMVGAGTPAYMAPEQVRGEDPTPQTDIYSLGIVLYEMLTGGERPFTGEMATKTGTTAEKVRWEQVHLKPILPSHYNKTLSNEMEAIILKCLEKDPGNRYQNTSQFLESLYGVDSISPEEAGGWEAGGDGIHEKPIPERIVVEPERIKKQLEKEAEDSAKVFQVPAIEPDSKTGIRRKRGTLVVVGIAAVVLIFLGIFWGLGGQDFTSFKTNSFLFSADYDGITDIYFLNSGWATQRITYSKGQNSAWDPARANDGSIFFTCNRYDWKSEICVMNPKNGQVSRSIYSPGKTQSWDAAPTNYGVVFFTSNRFGLNEILLLDDKAMVNQVFYGDARSESWDPTPTDDYRLFFTSNREDGKAEIYALENGLVKRITYTAADWQSWDPTIGAEGKMYFTSNREEGKPEIYVMELSGIVKRVTHTNGEFGSWNPVPGKDDTLFFTSNRLGKNKILFMSEDGSIHEVISIPGNEEGRLPVADERVLE